MFGFILALIWVFIWFLVGRSVGERCGNAALGGAVGVFLGPVGLILLAATHPVTVSCLRCGAALREGDSFCPSCGQRRTHPQTLRRQTSGLRRSLSARREVVCPHCEALLRAICGVKALKVRCPRCGKTFRPVPYITAPSKRPKP